MSIMAAATGVLLAAFSCVSARAEDSGMPVRMTTIAAGGGKTLKIVAVELKGSAMEVVSYGAPKYGKRERFEDLAKRSGAVAAINGCYFDMKTGKLVGHVYNEGQADVKGAFSAAFAVGKDGRVTIAQMRELGDPNRYRVIITCVDILMRDGKIMVKSKSDLVRNGHNPSKSNDIYQPARWTAIGVGSSGTVYLVVTPSRMRIYDFVREVKEHTEIVDLLGLDGGSSSGLYYRGQVLVRPVRTIPSVIVARASAGYRGMLAEKTNEGDVDAKLVASAK